MFNIAECGPIIVFRIHRNDWEIGHRIKSKTGQDRFYSDIKSAAESGWDFSTRWFYNKYDNHKGENEYCKY